MGIAHALMLQTHKMAKEAFMKTKISLQVRASNVAALGLYQHKMNYKFAKVEKSYYCDGEDAHVLVKDL